MTKADVVYKEAASWLNDSGMTMWTFGKLRPWLRRAFVDLLNELLLNGIPVIKEETSSPITIAIGTTVVTSPTDLITPIKLFERASGSSDNFVPMTEKMWTPQTQPEESLRYWSWREETINIIGATTAREVKVHYQKGLPIPKEPEDSIGVINGELYLGPATAGYAALSIGRDSLHATMMPMARESLSKIITINVKGGQRLPVRRIPYHHRSKRRLF